MSRHVTYRGHTVDMDSMRSENASTIAIGNAGTNARGDQLATGGAIAKTADQIARERHRVQTTVVSTGLKGPMPDADIATVARTPVKPTTAPKKANETELPTGDIMVDE